MPMFKKILKITTALCMNQNFSHGQNTEKLGYQIYFNFLESPSDLWYYCYQEHQSDMEEFFKNTKKNLSYLTSYDAKIYPINSYLKLIKL